MGHLASLFSYRTRAATESPEGIDLKMQISASKPSNYFSIDLGQVVSYRWSVEQFPDFCGVPFLASLQFVSPKQTIQTLQFGLGCVFFFLILYMEVYNMYFIWLKMLSIRFVSFLGMAILCSYLLTLYKHPMASPLCCGWRGVILHLACFQFFWLL